MNKPKSLSIAMLAGLGLLAGCKSASETTAAVENPADYVNPFIGASTSVDAAGAYHGLGKTFPGATTPFGMAQMTPNTISGGDNSSGYSYEHQTIEGFTFSQMSGVGWFGDLANFMAMPTTGELKLIPGKEDGSIEGYRSKYDKETETAKAGYYSADLTDYGIKVEGTATPHCGYMKVTYPKHEKSRLQIDLAHRSGGTSMSQTLEMVDDHTIEGSIVCTPEGGGWGDGEGNVSYTLYYHAELSQPITDWGVWSADIPEGASRHKDDVNSIEYQRLIAAAPIERGVKSKAGKHIGFFTEFPTEEGQELDLKVGLSYVDIEGARNNFKSEIAGKDFDKVSAEARDAWNKALSAVKISGGTDDERTVFYTSLYHTMIDPRVCADVDGRYVGGDLKVHEQSPEFTKRTIFSGWDVFRSQFPLMTIIRPDVVSDQINSLITMADESGRGYFERWELLNAYSGCMLGNPALPVLADSYVKGIRNFDVDKAIEYGIKSSEKFSSPDSLGYLPEPLSVSNTLEYAYADWCLGAFAEAAGKADVAERFKKKGQDYRNVFNAEAGWFCPRNADGSWQQWDDESLYKEWFGCMESNLLQQGWFVPQDYEGMFELMGGREKVVANLEKMFEDTPQDLMWNKYYNHANEPVHFVPFLFNLLDKPWLTQKWTRHICANGYKNKVEGLVGNEDAGQMSAWYVLAASGIHPTCPGTTRMEITSPVFDKAEFALDDAYHKGGKFTIVAHDNSPENVYIDHATLNGKEYNKCYIDFADIADGATLELYMADKPNEKWGLE